MAQPASHKLKRQSHTITLELSPNPDILAGVAARDPAPFCVGFAAETEDLEAYARDKLARKGIQMIAANNVAIAGQGFHSDDNALEVFWDTGQQSLALASKAQLARQLIQLIAQRMKTTENPS